jgi:DNA-binding transcriptional LysR family regulator
MERAVGSPLILRDQGGGIGLSQMGLALADHAEGMERHARLADAELGQDIGLVGTVRLTAVPFILNHMIVPNIGGFAEKNPALRISLVPDNRNLSLTRREVDIAIRFGEPHDGGNAVLAQRLGKVYFSVFVAKAFRSTPEVDLPWLAYDPVAAHLPQAGWTDALTKSRGQKTSELLVHDLETAYEAILHTPLRALLPDAVADKDTRLLRLEGQANRHAMCRDVWLMRHRDMRGVDRIDAATEWLKEVNLFD